MNVDKYQIGDAAKADGSLFFHYEEPEREKFSIANPGRRNYACGRNEAGASLRTA